MQLAGCMFDPDLPVNLEYLITPITCQKHWQGGLFSRDSPREMLRPRTPEYVNTGG